MRTGSNLGLKRIKIISIIISFCVFLITIYLALIYLPLPKQFTAPAAQKIFYFHVPLAWVAYLAFFVVFICSILLLKTNNLKWDRIAVSATEIGIVFCTLAIITGAIWGKAEWDSYWRWEDTKLTTTFILLLIYLASMALRSSIDEPHKKARLASVFGIIGISAVPLSFVSALIWQSLHPQPVVKGTLDAEMGLTLLVGVIAFTFLFIYLLIKRVELENLELRLEDIKDSVGGLEDDW